MDFDRTSSIEQLEGTTWGEPEYDSHLVLRCHTLRKKALNEFDVEDLRIMIGQNIGLDYLVPLGLEALESNIFAEGDLYEGDLLKSILTINSSFGYQTPNSGHGCASYLKQTREAFPNSRQPTRSGKDGFRVIEI